MKLRILSVALIFLGSTLSPPNAATVTDKIVYNKKTVLTYTVVDSVTMDPKGCKDVYIKYTIDKSYFFPNAYVMFGLYAKDKNEAQSVYVQPGNGKGTQGKDAWVGEKEMIFAASPRVSLMSMVTRSMHQHFQKESTHSWPDLLLLSLN